MESKNTSILAPVYYYEVAKKDFGSVSRFFRVMMKEYIKTRYGRVLEAKDVISDCEVVDILLAEKQRERGFVQDTLKLVKNSQVEDDVNKMEAEVTIQKALNNKQSKFKKIILGNKDYFEGIFNRVFDDNDNLEAPPFGYIEKKYGLNQNQVLDLLHVYENYGVLNEKSIEGLV